MSLRFAGSSRPLSRSIGQLLGLGMALFFGSQSLISCGSEDDPSCNEGDEKPCPNPACPDDLGAQVCRADGTYSTCQCGSGAGGSTMTGAGGRGAMAGASGSAGSSMGPAGPSGAVGLPCTTDGDCTQGLTCIASTTTGPFRNGGPENGYCTTTCATNDDCRAIDQIAGCVTVQGGATQETTDDVQYCMEVCFTNNPSDGEAKCHLLDGARTDLACQFQGTATQTRELGICIPTCQSDTECGNGRFCDLSSGVCTDQAGVGAAIGADCAGDPDCASGFCLSFINGPSFCSGRCTYGSIGGCGFDATGVPAGARQAACLDPLQGRTQGVGDVGACGELCDTAADCEQAAAGWTCESLATRYSQRIADLWGRTGFCAPPQPAPADAG